MSVIVKLPAIEHPAETPLASALHKVYRRWAGNMGLGDHMAETWNAIDKAAREYLLDQEAIACANCGSRILAGSGSLGAHGGLTDAGDRGLDRICGYCAGLELSELQAEPEAAAIEPVECEEDGDLMCPACSEDFSNTKFCPSCGAKFRQPVGKREGISE